MSAYAVLYCHAHRAGMPLKRRAALAAAVAHADFGFARIMAQQERIHTRTFGTVTHMPPELLSDGEWRGVAWALSTRGHLGAEAQDMSLCGRDSGSHLFLQMTVRGKQTDANCVGRVAPVGIMSAAADVYALGVLMWEVYMAQHVFKELSGKARGAAQRGAAQGSRP